MKANRDADALAARFRLGANTAPALPSSSTMPRAAAAASEAITAEVAQERSRTEGRESQDPGKAKSRAVTVQVTLRPSVKLLRRYTKAAAERMGKEVKRYTAQQLMLEQLEKGP